MIYVNEVIKDLFKKEVCQSINCGSSDKCIESCIRYKTFKSKIKQLIKETRDS